jgi:hypothetical protein
MDSALWQIWGRQGNYAYNSIFGPENRNIAPFQGKFFDIFDLITGGWHGLIIIKVLLRPAENHHELLRTVTGVISMHDGSLRVASKRGTSLP